MYYYRVRGIPEGAETIPDMGSSVLRDEAAGIIGRLDDFLVKKYWSNVALPVCDTIELCRRSTVDPSLVVEREAENVVNGISMRQGCFTQFKEFFPSFVIVLNNFLSVIKF